MNGPQYRPFAHPFFKRRKGTKKFAFVDFAQKLFSEKSRNGRHILAYGRVMLGKARMGAARIGDDQRIPFRYGQGRDDGRVGHFEIDFVEAAAGDARLVEQAAGLAEIFVFGKMADRRLVFRRQPSAQPQIVEDLRDQHLERGGRGHARAAEHRAFRIGGKSAEAFQGKACFFQPRRHAPRKRRAPPRLLTFRRGIRDPEPHGAKPLGYDLRKPVRPPPHRRDDIAGNGRHDHFA